MLSYQDCACTRPLCALFRSLHAWAHLVPANDDGGTGTSLQAARLVAAGDELVLAVNDGSAAECARLIANGASPNACSSNGVWTPLSLACKSGQLEMVRLLLARGADPNHCSPNGSLPLAITAHQALAECAQLLLEHGASPLAVCPRFGQSADELAETQGCAGLERMIAEHTRQRRRARLRRHARVVDECCRALLVLYNEVAYRPGNRGFLLAQAEFEHEVHQAKQLGGDRIGPDTMEPRAAGGGVLGDARDKGGKGL